MKKNIIININDKNDTKSKIIYDNVITSMEKMSLNKSEQIEYLKNRITKLEQEQKKKTDLVLISLVCLLSLIIGISLLILNFYTLGSLIIFASCAYGIIKTYKISNIKNNFPQEKYEEIETIREVINSKLK